jgi:hypothetical protein
LEALTKHKSGEQSTWEVFPNSLLKIEKTVAKDSYFCVDPVNHIRVTLSNGGSQIMDADDSNAQGI